MKHSFSTSRSPSFLPQAEESLTIDSESGVRVRRDALPSGVIVVHKTGIYFDYFPFIFLKVHFVWYRLLFGYHSRI